MLASTYRICSKTSPICKKMPPSTFQWKRSQLSVQLMVINIKDSLLAGLGPWEELLSLSPFAQLGPFSHVMAFVFTEFDDLKKSIQCPIGN